jgi:hypothetical protein
MLSHARVNSKSVRGAAKGARVAADIACAGGGIGAGAGVDAGVRVGSLCGSGSATAAGVGTLRVSNTVSSPDMRKIPPPTRPADFASRTCLASLNDVSVGFGTAGAGGIGVDFSSGDGGAGVEGVWETRRELMGFSRRSLSSLVSWVTMGGLSSSSTMVMGTRRRLGGAVEEEDDAGGGGEAEKSIGADRCQGCTCDLSETVCRECGKSQQNGVLSFPSCLR